MVTVPDSDSLDLSSQATLEAWVNPSALDNTWRTVAVKEQPGQIAYGLYANNNRNARAGIFTPPPAITSSTPARRSCGSTPGRTSR